MKSSRNYKIKAKVWIHPGEMGVWHFVNIPKSDSIQIREKFGKSRRGFGSLPVEVRTGKMIFKTSIFPDSKSGTYLLPLKAEVRKKEKFGVGDEVAFSIKILDE